MRRLIFRKAASADLRGVAPYTRSRWGEEQAAEYVSNLRNQINSLREFPLRFPEFDGTRDGLRRMSSGHHAVFYLVSDEQIEVVRILHEAMDFGERLR